METRRVGSDDSIRFSTTTSMRSSSPTARTTTSHRVVAPAAALVAPVAPVAVSVAPAAPIGASQAIPSKPVRSASPPGARPRGLRTLTVRWRSAVVMTCSPSVSEFRAPSVAQVANEARTSER